MDLASTLLTLGSEPVSITEQAMRLRGTWLPLALPLQALPLQPRARLLAAHPEVPLPLRVGSCLEAELLPEAWGLVMNAPGPLGGSLELCLATWAAREHARLELPAARGAFCFADRAAEGQRHEAELALSDARETLAGLIKAKHGITAELPELNQDIEF